MTNVSSDQQSERPPSRIVVVGASSGLGRCIGVHLGQNGARVALLARREDELATACAEAGNSAVAIRCDVTDEAGVNRAIDEAAERLGGIDGLLYSTGMGTVRPIEDTDATLWRRTFDTNVIGASLVTSAALPHLKASHGVAAYLSSVSGSLTPPWPGLANYAVSKAALERLIEAWRGEHPDVGFTTVIVGDCTGGEGDAQTQFSAGWDGEMAARYAPIWMQRGLLAGALLDVNELIAAVEMVLFRGSSADIPKIAVTPRLPPSSPAEAKES